MMVQACNNSPLEAEAGGLGVQGEPGQYIQIRSQNVCICIYIFINIFIYVCLGLWGCSLAVECMLRCTRPWVQSPSHTHTHTHTHTQLLLYSVTG
jgi:hypothetical protein